MPTIDDLQAALALEHVGPDHYRGANLPSEHGVVFGGQLLAQALVAARQGHDAMRVKTLHTVFARGARPDDALDIVVEPMSAGRTFASSTVSISQSGRLCTRSIVLLDAEEDDVIRHAAAPERPSTPESAPLMHRDGAWEVRVVDGVDISDPDAVGPAELDVWSRFEGAPDDPTTGQDLLAFASDGFLIGTAMRPHPGVGQALAHRTLSTGVISHTLTFHEPFPGDSWLLLSHTSPYAGHGRTYGRADVFTPEGGLVASYVQDAMVRPMPERRGAL